MLQRQPGAPAAGPGPLEIEAPELAGNIQDFTNEVQAGHGIDLKGVEAYTLDERESLSPLEYGRYQDQKICLRLDFYKNGSSTQIILKNREGVYFLPAFFGTPQKVDTLEEAKELWLKNSTLASNSGDFY